jgi:hypothetical protein
VTAAEGCRNIRLRVLRRAAHGVCLLRRNTHAEDIIECGLAEKAASLRESSVRAGTLCRFELARFIGLSAEGGIRPVCFSTGSEYTIPSRQANRRRPPQSEAAGAGGDWLERRLSKTQRKRWAEYRLRRKGP